MAAVLFDSGDFYTALLRADYSRHIFSDSYYTFGTFKSRCISLLLSNESQPTSHFTNIFLI